MNSSSDMHGQQAHPGLPPNPKPIETQLNGYPPQNPSAAEIPSPPLEHDKQPNGFSTASIPAAHTAPPPTLNKSEDVAPQSSLAPVTEGTSGITATAPFLSEAPVIPESSRQPATPPSPVDQIMTETDSHTHPKDELQQPSSFPTAVSVPVVATAVDLPDTDMDVSDPPKIPITESVSETSKSAYPDTPVQASAENIATTTISENVIVEHAPSATESGHVEAPAPASATDHESAILPDTPDAIEVKPLPLHQESATSIVTPSPAQGSEALPTSETVSTKTEAPGNESKHEREEEEDDAPSAKRTKTQDETEASPDFKVPSLPQTPVQEQPPQSTPAEPAQGIAQYLVAPIDSSPMSDLQHKKLVEGIRNIKKSKSSQAFHRPVDPVALNLPNYFDVIKHPMDLGTIEQKLKDRKYSSVNDYIDDFNLMIGNCITFNGPQHLVSVAGLNMKAQFAQQIRKLPRSHEPMPAPPLKKRQSDVAIPREPKRRESRQSFGTAQSPVGEAFALGPNGVPLIRRDSMAADGRPKREIHRPKPKDLPYTAKPKKKKYEMELKFCEYVQTEMMRGRYKQFAYPFYDPVDPVALALPNYFKTIKKPMDMGTVGRNLKTGQYENAAEYKADVNLMFSNCYLFNPETDAVHQMGKQYEAVFVDLWRGKEEWISANLPVSEKHSPEAESESEEEEEEEDEEDERVAKLSAIQEQMALLNAQAQALLNGKVTKPAAKATAKTKTPKPGKVTPAKKGRKPSGGASSLAMRPEKKQKLHKSKLKPVTVAQKHEISQKVTLLDPHMQSEALNLIVKALNDAGRHEDARKGADGEFDIEKIPDDALRELLKMVRSHTSGGPEGGEPVQTTEHRHSTTHRSSKPKKNKPMSKYEQEDRISRLKGQLESFQNPGSDSQSPDLATPGEGPETSGDESESGSESEEE